MSYTVIGDTVNLGARLESLNKDYGTRIIISEATRAALKGRYDIRPLGEVVGKGQIAARSRFTRSKTSYMTTGQVTWIAGARSSGRRPSCRASCALASPTTPTRSSAASAAPSSARSRCRTCRSPTPREQQLGAAVSESVRERYGVVQDANVHRYVTLVGTALAQAAAKPNLPWTFIVLDTDAVNAFAAPGGFVHITRGALALMQDEAELAGVLGHELIHVTERHTISAIQKNKSIQMGADETLSGNAALLNQAGRERLSRHHREGLRARARKTRATKRASSPPTRSATRRRGCTASSRVCRSATRTRKKSAGCSRRIRR